MNSSRTRTMLAARIALVLVLIVLVGCRAESTLEPETAPVASPPPLLADDPVASALAMPPEALMAALEEELRDSLAERYAALQAAIDASSPSAAELAKEYGRTGIYLLAFEFEETAVQAFELATLNAPGDTRWWYYQAHAYELQGMDSEAIPLFEAVMAAQPEDVATIVRLARLLRDAGQPEEAKALLDRALTLAPNTPMAHFFLGQMASERGDYEVALQHYEQARAMDPKASAVNYPLGQALQALGRESEAEPLLKERSGAPFRLEDPLALEIERVRGAESSYYLVRRTRDLIDAGEYEDAERQAEAAVSRRPNDLEALTLLGSIRYRMRKFDEAEVVYERAVALEPSYPAAAMGMATFHERAGDMEAALSALEAVLEVNPEHEDVTERLMRVYRVLQRCSEAVSLAERLLPIRPASTEMRLNLAMCQVETGAYAEAVETVQGGLEVEPAHLGLRDAMARLLSALPDPDLRDPARATLMAQGLVQETLRPETLETLAMARAAAGNSEAAGEAIGEALAIWDRSAAGGSAESSPYREHLERLSERFAAGEIADRVWPEYLLRQ